MIFHSPCHHRNLPDVYTLRGYLCMRASHSLSILLYRQKSFLALDLFPFCSEGWELHCSSIQSIKRKKNIFLNIFNYVGK